MKYGWEKEEFPRTLAVHSEFRTGEEFERREWS